MVDTQKAQSVLHKVSSGLTVAGTAVGAVALAIGSVPLPTTPAGWWAFGLLVLSAVSGAIGHGSDKLAK
jgi:hypothetical protein